MSSFRVALVFLCLVLGACGFQPVYGNAQKSLAQNPGIEIGDMPNRDGQYFRNILVDRLQPHGVPQNARYFLKLSAPEKSIFNIGIRRDATATRGQMQIASKMQLIEKSSGQVVLERNLKSAGSYNLLDNQLATMVSQQNLTESLLREISDDAVIELNLYLGRNTP